MNKYSSIEYGDTETPRDRVFIQALTLFHAQEATEQSDGSMDIDVVLQDSDMLDGTLFNRLQLHYAPMEDGDLEAISIQALYDKYEVRQYIIELERLPAPDSIPLEMIDTIIPDNPGSLTVKTDYLQPMVFAIDAAGDERCVEDTRSLMQLLAFLEACRDYLTFPSQDASSTIIV